MKRSVQGHRASNPNGREQGSDFKSFPPVTNPSGSGLSRIMLDTPDPAEAGEQSPLHQPPGCTSLLAEQGPAPRPGCARRRVDLCTCKHSRLGGFSGRQLPSSPPSSAAREGSSAPARRITQLRARKACTHREPSAPRPPYTSTRRASPAAAAIPPLRSAAASAAAPSADAAPRPAPPRPPGQEGPAPRPRPSPARCCRLARATRRSSAGPSPARRRHSIL